MWFEFSDFLKTKLPTFLIIFCSKNCGINNFTSLSIPLSFYNTSLCYLKVFNLWSPKNHKKVKSLLPRIAMYVCRWHDTLDMNTYIHDITRHEILFKIISGKRIVYFIQIHYKWCYVIMTMFSFECLTGTDWISK